MAYSPLQLALKYLFHQLTAHSGKGHGIHSPFVFDFVEEVLNDRRNFYPFKSVEDLRSRLLLDQRLVERDDQGAGPAQGSQAAEKIARIARRSAKSPRLGQLLFRIVQHYQPVRMLELGTSLGISTAYLASANHRATVWTMEGNAAIASRAEENFQSLGLKNIRLIRGNFDHELPRLLEKEKPFDLVFIDGNHREEPTLRYFNWLWPHLAEGGVMIFDDIHWSRGMENAWSAIGGDSRVMLSADLFFFGLVFRRTESRVKQHFRIRY